MADYYMRVASALLPHLEARPVTLKRYPDGVSRPFFYEKDAPSFTPEWVKTFPVPRAQGGPDIRYIVIDDRRTLAWTANLANLEIHPFLHRVPHLDRPTSVVFDLDPGPGADVLTAGRVALLLRALLVDAELESFAKVSGSKGLQIHVPLNSPRATYAVTQPFAGTVAEWMEREHPALVVADMAKERRAGKVFIDWSQNAAHKTTVAVYSLRARSRPQVSMPVTWDELEAAVSARDAAPLTFSPDAALARLEKSGDLFAPVLTLRQELPAAFTERLGVASRSTRSRPKPTKKSSAPAAQAAPPQHSSPATQAATLRRSRQGGRRRFVVQWHASRQPHYDVRLEMHDALKSWSVPKGVPTSPGERRLAMATEDHPLDYLDFEGIIPAGEYGAGTVMVWDIGAYDVVEGSYHGGSLLVHLAGEKLRGEWRFVRDRADPEKRRWFLLKSGVAMGALPAARAARSAKTGRTTDEIAAAKDAVWHSNRPAAAHATAAPRPVAPARPAPAVDLSALPRTRAEFITPMLARLATALPEGDDWQYEVKLDGYRALAVKSARTAHLLSRNANVLDRRFPAVVAALAAVDDETVLDGEVVALDPQGRPSFNLLQDAAPGTIDVVYYAFDLLVLRGRDLRRLALSDRRALLEDVVARLPEPIRLSPVFDVSAADLVAAARAQGLEGVIAKRTRSAYEPGQRSGAWTKVRVHQGQELVVGGYVPGARHFESLLVGYHDGDGLKFVGKVRNGFVPATRQKLFEQLRPLRTRTCPFVNLPERRGARRGKALTAEEMRSCQWVEPRIVVQVAFTDWTGADHLRHARFVGVRDDRDARDVVRERPTPARRATSVRRRAKTGTASG